MMSDPVVPNVPDPVTAAPVVEQPGVVLDNVPKQDPAAVVEKPSDLGSFHPPTLGEMQAEIDVLKARLDALEKSAPGSDSADAKLLRRQMDYIADTYIREPHFPRE